MRGAMPPWLPDPLRLHANAREGEPRGAVGWLTGSLFGLSILVVIASTALRHRHFGELLYPLAAILACVGAGGIARWRRLDAARTQSLFLGLTSLTPWLVFAWNASARVDSDGDAGGALAAGPLGPSSVLLLLVLPPTLLALDLLPVRAARRGEVGSSALLLTALVVVSSAFTAMRPTAAGLLAYERDVLEPGASTRVEGWTVDTTPRGGHCVTTMRPPYDRAPSRALTHRCASTVTVHTQPRRRSLPRTGLFVRPVFLGQVFVHVEGQILGGTTAPRYLLYIAPLWEWIVGAALAIACALGHLRLARERLSAWRALPARQAIAESGHARCDDGTLVPLQGADATRVGPVVLLGESAPTAPFRGAITAQVVLPGELAAWERTLAACDSLAVSFALAMLWLPAAPLLAAPLLGMFSPIPSAR